MKNYDPNIRRGVHTVQITLQQWRYIGNITIEVEGSCRGRSILDFDFECEDGECKSDCNLRYHEEGEYFTATLKDNEGNTLGVSGDSEEFNDMIVKIEILDFK